MNKRTKLPFWATIFSLGGVAILCTLGTWQLQRLEWKNDIIAKLEAAYESEGNTSLDFSTLSPGDFAYGRAEGIFMPQKAFLLGPRVRTVGKDKEVGKDLIAPLKTPQGTLLVNMGWTDSASTKDLPIHRLKNRKISFGGLARQPHWNSFTPDNEPENDLWFKADITEIAALKSLENPIPFMLTAYSASHKFDAAFPNNARWQPKNDHLQYAFFWFAMALALSVIYTLRFIKKSK